MILSHNYRIPIKLNIGNKHCYLIFFIVESQIESYNFISTDKHFLLLITSM